MANWLVERFGLTVPVVGAPMAGVSGGELAAAISAAGGLGMIGVSPAVSADWIRTQAAATAGTPYGIGLMAWSLVDRPEHLEVVLELRPPLVSVSFGDLAPSVGPLRQAGIVVAAQAGSVDDARTAIAAGVDVIVARGAEAGGHGRALVGTLPLLQAVLDLPAADGVPVLAAGGISGPRGLAAVLAAGAAGAWIGTAFLTAAEALTPAPSRDRLLAAGETDTAYGTVFDAASRVGWPDEFGGRALRNAFFDRWQGREAELAADETAHAEFVAGNRAADPAVAAAYAGQGVGALTTSRPAADVVADLATYRTYLTRALD